MHLSISMKKTLFILLATCNFCIATAEAVESYELPGYNTPSTPTVTSNYYVHQSGNTTAWTDKQDYTLSAEAKVTTASSLPVYFKYYNNAAEAAATPHKKLVLALGDSSKEDGCVDLGNVQISNGVIKYTDNGVAKSPDDGGSGYAPDDASASPLTYSYGILELAENSYVKLSETSINGSVTTADMQNITKGWAFVGSLQLGKNARLALDNRSLSVTGQPYTSLGTGARIDILKDGVISFGASNEGTWDAIVLSGADGKTGTIINTSTSDHTAVLGTSSAKDVEFRDVVLTTQGYTPNITIAAKLGGAHVYANSSSRTTTTVTFTGDKADGYDKAIKQLRTGDGFSNGKASVYLLNREENVVFDSLIIGSKHTVGVFQEGEEKEVSTVSVEAYSQELSNEGFYEYLSFPVNGLYSYRYSELEANLSLGVSEMSQWVSFAPALNIKAYGQTVRTEGYGLNMLGNHVKLVGNIALTAYYDYSQPQNEDSEILLFYNVASLTLLDTVYDENKEMNYFDYTAGIAAATIFSTSAETPVHDYFYYSSFDEPTEENGSLTGWFIEYRDNGEQNGTGDVYLVYRAPKKMDSVPEPATGTLSLLALAALAARRRRR